MNMQSKKQQKENVGIAIMEILEENDYEKMPLADLPQHLAEMGYYNMSSKRLGQYLSYWIKKNPNLLMRSVAMHQKRLTTWVGYWKPDEETNCVSLNTNISQYGNTGEQHGLLERREVIGNA
jgi:hypothetical protein